MYLKCVEELFLGCVVRTGGDLLQKEKVCFKGEFEFVKLKGGRWRPAAENLSLEEGFVVCL